MDGQQSETQTNGEAPGALHPQCGLCFANPGLLDLRLVTTFGVSVKPNGHPIGKFGTGLKYALAGLVRLGAKVDIWVESRRYRLGSVTTPIRDAEHELLYLYKIEVDDNPDTPRLASAIPLPFASSLGGHWTPWMIYRELWSNAMDEQGEVAPCEPGWSHAPLDGHTLIVVNDCPALIEIANNEDDFIIPREAKPLWVSAGFEAYEPSEAEQPEKGIFFRGIRVSHDDGNRFAFRWNILQDIALTEDRTLGSTYNFTARLQKAIWEEGSEALWDGLWAAGFAETKFGYEYAGTPSAGTQDFWRKRLMQGKHGKLWAPKGIRKRLLDLWGDEIVEAEEAMEVPGDFTTMIAKAPPRTSTALPTKAYISGYETGAVDDQLRGLRLELRYWKAVAKAFAGQLGLPAMAIEVPEGDPIPGDDVPF